MTFAGHIILDSAATSIAARGGGAQRQAGATFIAVTAAAVFIAAGAAKLWNPSAAGLDGVPRALGAAEVLLGCWLVSGVARRVALLACGGIFATFAVYHVWELMRGDAEGCACFGTARPSHAWLSALCSAGSVACLLASRRGPVSGRLFETPIRLAFCATAVWTLATVAIDKAAVARPRSWADDAIARLPEAQRAQLRQGLWRVLFIDPSCESCQRLLAETESIYLQGLASERVLLVLTGNNAHGGTGLLASVGAEVLALPEYTPRCLPAVVFVENGSSRTLTCGGSQLPSAHSSPS